MAIVSDTSLGRLSLSHQVFVCGRALMALESLRHGVLSGFVDQPSQAAIQTLIDDLGRQVELMRQPELIELEEVTDLGEEICSSLPREWESAGISPDADDATALDVVRDQLSRFLVGAAYRPDDYILGLLIELLTTVKADLQEKYTNGSRPPCG